MAPGRRRRPDGRDEVGRMAGRRGRHRHRAFASASIFVDQVVILCGGEAIARYQRSYGPGAFVFDPLHCLALIETKPNALDRAAPLKDWDVPGGGASRPLTL